MEIIPKNLDTDEFYESQTKVSDDDTTGILDSILEVKKPESFTSIQMDNAPAHKGHNVLITLNEHCEANHFEIGYTTQPPQSPDFNICDLSIFNSLQMRVNHLKDPNDKSLIRLWEATKQCFDDYPKETIFICFGHLYANYNECLKHDGDNRYKSPHAHVRQKYFSGQPLNFCHLSYAEYENLKTRVNNYFNPANA